MTWAQRLKRVFDIDVSTCIHCGGAVRIVATIEVSQLPRHSRTTDLYLAPQLASKASSSRCASSAVADW